MHVFYSFCSVIHTSAHLSWLFCLFVLVLSGLSMDLESSSSPVDGAEVCVSTDESLCQHSELEESTETQLSMDCSDAEMDDSDSVISDRTVSSYSGFQGPLSRPAWALALYGEVFFSQEVVEYAYKLGSHTDSPSLEDKSQVGATAAHLCD